MPDPKIRPVYAALWSIAIPGFGQIYNGHMLKGALFILMEFVINTFSNLNLGVYYSFLLKIDLAQQIINYQWLLYYPCFYTFAIFEAYHSANIIIDKRPPSGYEIPYIATWLITTVAVIIGSGETPFHGVEKLGPIFLPVALSLLTLGGGTAIVQARRRWTPKS